MRKGGYIPANHWGRLYLRGASAEVKLVACYLMTCAHSTSAGVVRADATLMASDLGMAKGDMASALGDLVRRRFVVPYVAVEPVLAAPGGVIYSGDFGDIHAWAVPAILDAEPVINPNVGKRVAKDLADLLGDGQRAFWSALHEAYKDHRKNLPADFLAQLSTLAAMVERIPAGELRPVAHDAGNDVTGLVRDALAGVDTYDALGGAQPEPKTEAIGQPGGMTDAELHGIIDELGGARNGVDSESNRTQPAPGRVVPTVPSCFSMMTTGAQLAEAWNALVMRSDLEVAYNWTSEILDMASDRVAQLGGVDKIPVLMAKVEASDVLMGRAPDGAGEIYRLTFTRLCRESLFSSIMEGRFDNKVKPVTEPNR